SPPPATPASTRLLPFATPATSNIATPHLPCPSECCSSAPSATQHAPSPASAFANFPRPPKLPTAPHSNSSPRHTTSAQSLYRHQRQPHPQFPNPSKSRPRSPRSFQYAHRRSRHNNLSPRQIQSAACRSLRQQGAWFWPASSPSFSYPGHPQNRSRQQRRQPPRSLPLPRQHLPHSQLRPGFLLPP